MIGNQMTLDIKNFSMALRLANKLLKIRFLEISGLFAGKKLSTQMSLHRQHWEKLQTLQTRFNRQAAPLNGNEMVATLKKQPMKDIASLEEMLEQMHISQLKPVSFVHNQANCSSMMMPFSSPLPILDDPKPASLSQILMNEQQKSTLDEMIRTSVTYEEAKDDTAQYVLYLYVAEQNDDDLIMPIGLNNEQIQKKIIKYIKQQVSTNNELSIADYKALSILLNNIAYVLRSIRLNEYDVSTQNVKWLLLWTNFANYVIDETSTTSSLESLRADFLNRFLDPVKSQTDGLHQIEEAEAFFNKRIQFTYQIYPLFLPIVIEYTFLLEMIVKSASSDIDLFYAEQALGIAQNLLKMHLKVPDVINSISSQIESIQLRHTVIEAKIAYKNSDYTQFFNLIKIIEASGKVDVPVVDVFVLAALHHIKIDMPQAKRYLELAQSKFETLSLLVGGEECVILKEQRADLTSLKLEMERFNRNQLMPTLQQAIPGLKVKHHSTHGLLLYYPLQSVPMEVIKRFKAQKQSCVKVLEVFDHQRQGDKIYTGLQMSTLSFSCEEITKTVQSWLAQIERANNINSTKVAPAVVPPIVSTASKQKPKRATGGLVTLIEQPEEPYQKPQLLSKEKTHKAPAAAGEPMPIATAVPAALRECHAADFGFNIPNNPLVTPIYCSEAAQKLRRAKLFVMFKGIRGVEESVQKQFAEMLNPHPEGLLTVGMVNQAGVKLWRHPDALGDAWSLCALRFKRKGAAGWLRAVAEPEARVTVMNSDGKEEIHYLFSLGKPKHK